MKCPLMMLMIFLSGARVAAATESLHLSLPERARPPKPFLTIPARAASADTYREFLRIVAAENLAELTEDSPLARWGPFTRVRNAGHALREGLRLEASTTNRTGRHHAELSLDLGEAAFKLDYQGLFAATLTYSPIAATTAIEVKKRLSPQSIITLHCRLTPEQVENHLQYRRTF